MNHQIYGNTPCSVSQKQNWKLSRQQFPCHHHRQAEVPQNPMDCYRLHSIYSLWFYFPIFGTAKSPFSHHPHPMTKKTPPDFGASPHNLPSALHAADYASPHFCWSTADSPHWGSPPSPWCRWCRSDQRQQSQGRLGGTRAHGSGLGLRFSPHGWCVGNNHWECRVSNDQPHVIYENLYRLRVMALPVLKVGFSIRPLIMSCGYVSKAAIQNKTWCVINVPIKREELGYPTYFGQSHALTTQGAVKELLLPLANDLVDLPWLSKNLELHRKPSPRSPTEVYYWVYVITHNLSYSSWCFYYTPGVSHAISPQNGWFYGDQLVYLTLINFWWRKWLDKEVKMTYFPLKRMVTIDLHWVGATLLRKFSATTRHKIKGSVGTSLLNQSNNGTFGPRIRINFGTVPPIKPTPHSFTFGDYGHIWNREKPSDH